MTKLLFCGQAPSRKGDGRAFSGPSGRRLAALLSLRDYEHLRSQCDLVNLFPEPAEKRGVRGDAFDPDRARELGKHLIVAASEADDEYIVIACGHGVNKALTGHHGEFFSARLVEGVEVWCFPHPSGASAYWNDKSNVIEASHFLKQLLERSGIMMTR